MYPENQPHNTYTAVPVGGWLRVCTVTGLDTDYPEGHWYRLAPGGIHICRKSSAGNFVLVAAYFTPHLTQVLVR